MNSSDSEPATSRRLLSVAVPIFNEGECFPALLERLLALRDKIHGFDLELLFVNDGSSDRTAELLESAASQHSCVKVIQFSRNFGHQAALTAGMDRAAGDYVCIIDADLQDPPELIPEMLTAALGGFDVVYGKRRNRSGETWFKKTTASLFYRIITAICRVDIPRDTGDFRLVSRRLVLAFRELRETHRFIRGMVPWVGFRSMPLLYDRHERYSGSTKFPFLKMARFAMDAIFSFSNSPLRISTYLGAGMTLLSILGMITIGYLRLFTTYTVPGISAVLFVVLLTSGVQFIILGLIGEYIGRIFEQSKSRPIYIVASTRNLETPAG